MTSLRLIPLEDTVVFPNMGITLTIDVGDDERVVLVPRHENEFLEVGTIAEVSEQIRLPGGGRAVALSGEHRALIGAAQTGPDGELRVEVDERPDERARRRRTRELEREYRAVVEEILELRGDDGRIAAFLRAIAEPGALADSAGYSPNLSYEQKVELLRTTRRDRAPRAGRQAPAREPGRAAGAQAHPRGRAGGRREAAARVLPAQADGVDPQGAGRGRGARSPRSTAPRSRTPRCPRRSHEQALKELGRLERMGEQTGESSMIRTYLDWLIAVPWSKRSDEHLDPVGGARGARRRPRRPRGRQGPRDRVPGRAQAAPGPRHRGRPQVRARSSR